MTNRDIRASDADREGVVMILRDAYTEGRLTIDEFDERTTATYAARTWGQLQDLTQDLPVQPVLSAGEISADKPAYLPRLPPLRTEAAPPALTRRRRGPDARILPALLIWAVIAAAAGSPVIAGVLAVFFFGLLVSRLRAGGRLAPTRPAIIDRNVPVPRLQAATMSQLRPRSAGGSSRAGDIRPAAG
jgi:hypothetical protein